jgi:hypothetical protein
MNQIAASSDSRKVAAQMAGYIVAGLTVVAAILFTAWQFHLIYQDLREIGGWCGKVRIMIAMQIFEIAPWFVVLIWLGSCFCALVGHGRTPARWSFLIAMAVWLGNVVGQMTTDIVRNHMDVW